MNINALQILRTNGRTSNENAFSDLKKYVEVNGANGLAFPKGPNVQTFPD